MIQNSPHIQPKQMLLKAVFIVLFVVFGGVFAVEAQSLEILDKNDQEMILKVMDRQEKCWNKGDLPCFMVGYWESDSLKFIGSKGLTYGWESTLKNYQRSYPDKKTMGQLKFEIINMEKLGSTAALVVGKWSLTREKGNVSGHFSLIWKKMDGEWVIVADHSS